MKGVELYAKVRFAVRIEGISRREAARRFGIDPRTVAKMLSFSVPPGYRRHQPPKRPKLDPFVGIIDQILDEDFQRYIGGHEMRSFAQAGLGQRFEPCRGNLQVVAAGWQLGKPDVIARAPKPYTLPASGSDTYWNFVFRTPVDRTRWLKAIEIRPGDKRLVHHANVLVDRAENARHQEKQPGEGEERTPEMGKAVERLAHPAAPDHPPGRRCRRLFWYAADGQTDLDKPADRFGARRVVC